MHETRSFADHRQDCEHLCIQRHWESRSDCAVIRSILGVSAIVPSQKAHWKSAQHENGVEIAADGTGLTHAPITMKLKRLPLAGTVRHGHQPTRLIPRIANTLECVRAAFLQDNDKICRGKSGIVSVNERLIDRMAALDLRIICNVAGAGWTAWH